MHIEHTHTPASPTERRIPIYTGMPMSALLVSRWAEDETPRTEQQRQIEERICERGRQIIGFLRHVLTRQSSIQAFYGREFLTAIGGGKSTDDRGIDAMAEYMADDPLMRGIVSTIEQRIVSPENSAAKIADMEERAAVAPGRNEEQTLAVKENIAKRVRSVTVALREMLRADMHYHLSTLLRHAGGEELSPGQPHVLVESVVREHPFGPQILAAMENDIGAFGVKVNREIEPLLLMAEEIRRGRDLPAERLRSRS